MAFWQSFLRLRRGDLTLMVFAAFLAFAIAPATVHGAPLSPAQAQVVLLWLHCETRLQVPETLEAIEAALPPLKVRRTKSGRKFEPRLVLQAPKPTPLLLPHEAAFLSGVRTNVRRN